MEEIKNCLCGANVSDENTLIDTLYPMNRERTKWNMICQLHNCGCGRIIYGDTKEAVIEKWNNGLTDETDEFIDNDDLENLLS